MYTVTHILPTRKSCSDIMKVKDNGKNIVRVLDQRWSGHLAIVNVISSNFKEISKTLDAIIKSDKFTGEDVAKCIGLKSVMLGIEFRFSLILMRNFRTCRCHFAKPFK
jgi:hypothetical protein